ADAHRDVPDITFTSEDQDTYPIYLNGRIEFVQDNSMASPSFAGIMALAAQNAGGRQGNPAPILYSLANRHQLYGGAGVFRDTQSSRGSELLASALSAGYSPAAGLGSVDANLLVTHWGDAAYNIL